MEMIVNFSGGKDSCAMLAFLCENYPDIKKHVVFADTGWEHPDAEAWCKQIVEGQFGMKLNVARSKTKTFLSMAESRGMFPGMNQRQCTSDLKRDPIMTWVRNNVKDPVIINCMGLRAAESPGRAKKKKLHRNKRETNSKRTVWEWLPIHTWSDTQVFSYLEEKKIPLHPVYKYLKRFSCRVCIFMTKHDLHQVQEHDPAAINIISEIEKKIGFTMFQGGTIEEILQK